MKKYILLGILLILTIPSVFALLHPGFFLSDDGEWMIIRFSAFHQALRDGQFPVRFLTRLNYGYGYPVANFLYPGFMYLAEIFKLLGFGFVNSIKIILGLSMISSAVFCYFWLSKLFKAVPALCGALFYLYAPYHLYDAYTRGSVGEVLALAIVPFALWQIERKSLVWLSVGIGALILSHNTLAVLFLPLIVLYACLKREELKRNTYALFLGLGLASFFWIPALLDLQYTVFSKTSVSEFANYFAGTNLIGFSTLGIFLLTLCFLTAKKMNGVHYKLTLFMFVIGLVSLFFSSMYSSALWSILPASFIQFPFRLLSVVIVAGSFLLTSMLSASSKHIKIVLCSVVVFFAIISFHQYGTPAQFFDKGEGFYATNEGTTTVKNEYMPVWVKTVPSAHPEHIIEGSQVGISNVQTASNMVKFDSQGEHSRSITVNRVYFPGWKVFIGNEEGILEVESSKSGQLRLSGPVRAYSIKFQFGETPMRLFADVVSLTSFFILGFIAYNYKRKRQHV